MKLNELLQLNEAFNIDVDNNRSNTIGALLKLNLPFSNAFKRVLLELEISGEIFSKIQKLFPHGHSINSLHDENLSSISQAMKFNSYEIAMLVYFETNEMKDDVLVFDNDIMKNSAPIYLRVPEYDSDTDSETVKIYSLLKQNNELKPIQIDNLISTQLNRMQPNLNSFKKLMMDKSPLDGFMQLRTWVLFI